MIETFFLSYIPSHYFSYFSLVMTTTRPTVEFHLGDELHAVNPDEVTPETTLNFYLREKVHLTGTKGSCLEGGCGCCVVAVESYDTITKKKKVFAVNSCLVSIFSCHGWKIHTNEGIAPAPNKPHPLQEGLAKDNGSQCGFCSSGMIMNMYALLESGPVTEELLENSFGGNICRCTGYRPILQAFRKFTTSDIEDYKPCKKDNCEETCPTPCANKDLLLFDYGKSKWMKVYSLPDLLEIIDTTNATYKLVAGNTARGVYKNDPLPSVYIDITSVKELITWNLIGNKLILGGNITLNDTIQIFQSLSKQNSNFKYLSKLADHIDLVANIPVRNIGTLAGNLMIKHTHREFPSDIFLILETVNAEIVLADPSGNERRLSPWKFLTESMKKRVIKRIILSGYGSDYIYTSYKIMPRAQNVHAVVNAGFLFRLKNDTVLDCRIVYGAINPEFVHATNTERYLKNKPLFDNNTLQGALQELDKELVPDYVKPDATPEYRKNLAISLFYKFILANAPASKLSEKNKSGGTLLQRPLSTGSQEFTTTKDTYPVSEPIIKLEALAQTSGIAEYIEDKPDLPGQLFVEFVEANAPANSVITTIDTLAASRLPGFVAFFGKDDIPGKNSFTPAIVSQLFTVEEELFCSGTVQYYHQPVGIVVAKSQDIAIEAANLVQVNVDSKGKPKPLLNIRDVLKASADIRKKKVIHQTDFVRKRKGTDVKKVVEGEFYVDLQYHFHMELQCCNVIPEEDGNLFIYSSTQWMDAMQFGIANILGIKQNKITVKVRRLGGSYGAKILRSGFVAAAAALAAHKTRKPVKMRLPLEKNMEILGKRYPFLIKYKVGVNAGGVIQHLDADLYSDFGIGGNEPIDFIVLPSFQSGYLTDTWNFSTYSVKTDTHANAWTRAPGAVESTGAIEAIMEHIAIELNLDPLAVREANFDSKFPILKNIVADIKTWSNISEKKQEINNFNIANRWKKRGLSVVPMSWELHVIGPFTILVTIFHGDGSVTVTHGGVEMGQGINTKVAQVCAYKFGIPLDMVVIAPSNTIANPNNFASGGSLSSEACCWGTIKACDILLERLKPIRDKMNNPSWPELINKAHYGNVLLNATSIFFPEEPQIVDYPINGVAALEVEVDVLTGQFQILHADIIEDVGDSMNPLIDIGQLEGAFVMGLGYYTTEQIIADENGKILTNRTWNYHPPGVKDIPQSFRLKFPSGTPNKVGVLHSKAIAEPPCTLTVSVPLAIRNAIGSARIDAGSSTKWYPFNGVSSTENTFLNSLNDWKQYKL